MAVPIQNLRSAVASKRPVATSLAVGEIAVNYNEADPAIYLRGDTNGLIKVSPTFVGSTAPNATPGGAAGNSKGETWLDTSSSPATLKIWNGSAWNATYTLPSGSVLAGGAVLESGVTAATAATGDDSTLLATTAFVNAEIANDAPTKTGGGASGTWNISITGDAGGNAGTATALATARTISLAGDLSGSASFDGTSDITISGTIAADSVALGTDTTGNYVAAGSTSGNGISGSVSSEGGTFTVTSNATNANTASTIVFRDGSGNFSAGTISAALNGNASTATTLETTRTINGVNFNGSANITIESFVEDDDGTNATRYITFVDDSTASFKRLNEDANLTYNPATNTLTTGTFSGSLAGNATSATTASSASSAATLTTARTINGVSFNGSANIVTNPFSTGGTAYSNGFGGRYVSTSNPSGGSNGDIWYKV